MNKDSDMLKMFYCKINMHGLMFTNMKPYSRKRKCVGVCFFTESYARSSYY